MYATRTQLPAHALRTPPRGELESRAGDTHAGVRYALGEAAWARLPHAVQARFADCLTQAEYVGSFEIVRASVAGRLLSVVCRLIGTPIAPYTGTNVPAAVRVYADGAGGVVWERRYHFPGRKECVVSSTKRCDEHGTLIEMLPFGLSMPLEVFERAGVLHFLSTGYYFNCLGMRLAVPRLLPPGRTHVAHIDEGFGWFRFTMTVTHQWLGEVYFQTGRFRAAASEAL